MNKSTAIYNKKNRVIFYNLKVFQKDKDIKIVLDLPMKKKTHHHHVIKLKAFLTLLSVSGFFTLTAINFTLSLPLYSGLSPCKITTNMQREKSELKKKKRRRGFN